MKSCSNSSFILKPQKRSSWPALFCMLCSFGDAPSDVVERSADKPTDERVTIAVSTPPILHCFYPCFPYAQPKGGLRVSRFRAKRGGPIFSLAREKIGEKRALGHGLAHSAGTIQARAPIFRSLRAHILTLRALYSPRRLPRYTRFDSSCV